MRTRYDKTLLEALKSLLPEREQWRIETIRIIAEFSPITSYSIAKKLNEFGFNTRVSSVHPFLERLIETGLCSRESEWKKIGYKGVKITDKGIKLYEVLKSSLDSSVPDNH